MDGKTRLQYLQAIGIDVWIPRRDPVVPSIETDRFTGTTNEPLSPAFAADDTALSSETSVLVNRVIPDAESELGIVESDPIQSWHGLQEEVSVCRNCSLCETRTQTVFGTGSAASGWMVIGEAPGESEDRQGEPFVGKAGQLLTEMLRAIGLNRDDVFITNILKCRPPNNRDPLPVEVEACRDYLRRQIESIKPKIILAVGRISAQNLLQTDKPIGRLRGEIHSFNGIPLVVVYHPAYLLRSPLEKRKAWQDLQLAITTFDTIKD